MPQRYETYGPFSLEGDRADWLKRPSSDFWEEVEGKHAGLSTAIGVYIIAIRGKNGSLPWYVGMTKVGFEVRLNQHRKTFLAIAEKCGPGCAEIFFIARRQLKRDAFLKQGKSPRLGIDSLETRLITTCLRRNPNLHNDKKMMKDTVVPGYMNDKGKRSSAAASLNALITGNVS